MNNNSLVLSNLSNIKSSESSFYAYLQEIQKFPMLSLEEEYEYGTRFQKNGDTEAAKMLIQSHLRLVVKIATKFRSYGLPIGDLVSEGNVGLIQALKKFDPIKGFRFSTYAMWWIKAYIQEYILRSWSLVKLCTTVAHKKLFFNLRKIRKQIDAVDEAFSPEQLKEISRDLNVSEDDVKMMNLRIHNPDSSLNRVIGDEAEGEEVIDKIASNQASQEQILINSQEKLQREKILKSAFSKLNEREQEIVRMRQLTEPASTLEDLSKIYKISKERVRQIEAVALEKIKKEARRMAYI